MSKKPKTHVNQKTITNKYRVVMKTLVNEKTLTFAIFVEAEYSQNAQSLAEAEFPEAIVDRVESAHTKVFD